MFRLMAGFRTNEIWSQVSNCVQGAGPISGKNTCVQPDELRTRQSGAIRCEPNPPHDPPPSQHAPDLLNDLGPHAFISEDLQQDGVEYSAIHKGNFLHARLDGSHCAIHFGNHSLVDNPTLFQAVHITDVEPRNDAVRIVRILQEAGHIAHEHEAFSFERDRGLSSRHVRVAVVDLAVLAARIALRNFPGTCSEIFTSPSIGARFT